MACTCCNIVFVRSFVLSLSFIESKTGKKSCKYKDLYFVVFVVVCLRVYECKRRSKPTYTLSPSHLVLHNSAFTNLSGVILVFFDGFSLLFLFSLGLFLL